MSIVIWRKKSGEIYYKLVKGTYSRYFVGMTNQYGHEILFIIKNVYYVEKKIPLKVRCIKRIIRFLHKFL